ncbi:hypothetical protein ACFL6B_01960 [Thermodesulfobacteriota bacterium]
MKLYKLEIQKEHLASLPEKESLFFIQIGTILNDINILHKITFFSNKETETEVERRALNSQSFFLLLVLSGKLHEGWKVLQNLFFRGHLSREYDEYLPDEAKQDLDKIKKYFGKANNLISKIRNKFSFHYDQDEIKNSLQNFPDDEPLEIYLSTSRGNCFYFASTVLIMRAVLESTGKDISDPQAALTQFFDEVLNVTGWMMNFLNYCLLVVPEKLGWDQSLIKETIELENPPNPDDVFLPPFLNETK